jgi:type VI secretion system secreted protein Hcp
MAHGDILLKIEGVDGESLDKGHEKHIHIDSFQFGVANQGAGHTGGGAGASKAIVHDMHMTKHVDKSSPMLYISSFNGKHFDKAEVFVRKAGEKPHTYLKLKMKQVFISGYHCKSHEGHIAAESFTLHFSDFEMEYVTQNKDGSAGSSIVKGANMAERSHR